ncbi:hypothetical protein GCM10011532_31120 [Christiangramia forsetii]|uniref:Transposase n=1 Tax=Christiangramia forsetii TaxID=411153 RepID=A0ABQ1WTE3_9FLAO|nr:hypothetical protein GCM10011532_31120 [Christiangramia forsetii]
MIELSFISIINIKREGNGKKIKFSILFGLDVTKSKNCIATIYNTVHSNYTNKII